MYNFAVRVFSNRKIQIVIVLLLTILAAVSVFQGSRNAISFSQDFQWDAARALVEGLDPYAISVDASLGEKSQSLSDFYRLFTDRGLKQKMEANQFPSLLLLLMPYTFLNPMDARIAWLVSNIIFTSGIVILLRLTFLRKSSWFEYTVLILLMLAGTPYRNQIGVGQHTLFSFFFFLLAVWLDECKPEGNRILITICMFISYFKYTLTAPLVLYLLYRKRYREFVISVIMHIILTVVSAFMIGKDVVYMIIAPLKVASALGAEGGLDLGALFGGGSLGYILGGVIALLLMVITFMLPKQKGFILYPLLLMWSLILTYHRTYDFFVISSVGVLLGEELKSEYGERTARIVTVYYYVLLFLIYFGLRVFNENVMSRVIIGGAYYIFVIVLTAMSIITIRNNKGLEQVNEEGK